MQGESLTMQVSFSGTLAFQCYCFNKPTCTELLCKLPGEVERDSSEVGIPQ